jgi:hypothetical protein
MFSHRGVTAQWKGTSPSHKSNKNDNIRAIQCRFKCREKLHLSLSRWASAQQPLIQRAMFGIRQTGGLGQNLTFQSSAMASKQQCDVRDDLKITYVRFTYIPYAPWDVLFQWQCICKIAL